MARLEGIETEEMALLIKATLIGLRFTSCMHYYNKTLKCWAVYYYSRRSTDNKRIPQYYANDFDVIVDHPPITPEQEGRWY